MKLKTYLLAAVALTSLSSHAELLESDWRATGDNEIVFDTETGKDWLKLNNTMGMSLNYVQSEMVAGGQFEYWRFASPAEVGELFEHGAVDYTYDPNGYTNAIVTTNGIEMMFEEFRYEKWRFSQIAGDNGSVIRSGYIEMHEPYGSVPEVRYYMNYDDSVRSWDTETVNRGIFLVSDTPVYAPISASLPGALGVFALGMAGFGLRVRRKR